MSKKNRTGRSSHQPHRAANHGGQAEATDTASAPVTRASRLPVDAIQESLLGHELLVADLAEKFKITERDVRLSIDRLRRKDVNVVRSALKTFTIPKDKPLLATGT